MEPSAINAEVTPRPSYKALHVLLPLHAVPLAAVPLFYHGSLLWPPLLLAALVAVSWLYVRRHPVLGFGPRALTRIIAHDNGDWLVEDAAGHRQGAHLAGNSVVMARMMLLNFRLADGHRRSRLLLGDEAGAEALRRLRAYLLSRQAAK